ncbi:MAG: 7-carboxy-7-deazaguanine synthase QueE [Acidobacteria bacterium]|nr:7-carboxy-7-deazaguanine synthase QueE [Acidobacteriota bacterium]MCA1611528.1 7-carboxy-7-deazaguanine synthase QueE [Acidobacteriota bacterium]
MPTVRVTEIFRSLQGESLRAGFPCAFVRLTGCALRCVWCDSAYAFSGGEELDVDEAARRVLELETELVEVTGGEPLEQEGVYALMDRLLAAGRTVLLETGGHVPIDRVDPRVIKIVDVKAPGSGMQAANLPENLELLGERDELKFVLADRRDFEWALALVSEKELDRARTVTFSPAWEGVDPAALAGWIRDSGRNVRLGLQLHKILWGDVPGK